MSRSRRIIKVKTRDEVREQFVDAGVTVKDWAARHGFKAHLVYQVLYGKPGVRGESHRIAVALGLKRGEARVA
jgi:gp16 family phage-associated protein